MTLGKLARVFETLSLGADFPLGMFRRRVCGPPSGCPLPLGRGVPGSPSASKGSTPGAAGAYSDSHNRHARPIDVVVWLVQYCRRPGASLQSLRSRLLAVEFHQLLNQPYCPLLRGSEPETPLSLLLGRARVALLRSRLACYPKSMR